MDSNDSTVSVIWFLSTIFCFAGCLNSTRCCLQKYFYLIDMLYEHDVSERRTWITPVRNKKIYIDRYIVIINPPGFPISIGLPEEYSNV